MVLPVPLTPILVAGLAAVHLVADRFPIVGIVDRDRWLSAAVGVSLAYVFVYLLPKAVLAGHQIGFTLAFVGLAAFFAVERLAHVANRLETGPSLDRPVYYGHVGAFAAYNVVIGYALASGYVIDGRPSFAIAMAMHLFCIDEGLRRHHAEAYHRTGRWILAGAIVIGAGTWLVLDVGEFFVAGSLAILAGGIMYNAIKEELPEDAESSLIFFVAGATIFLAIMALVP